MSNTPMRCWRCGQLGQRPGGAASSGSVAHRVVAAGGGKDGSPTSSPHRPATASLLSTSPRLEVLLLRVSSVDYWAYRPALQQVAAWYWTLKHPEQQSSKAGERAARAVAEVAWRATAPYHCLSLRTATGIIDEIGFPEAYWVFTTEERHGLGNDPIRSRRVDHLHVASSSGGWHRPFP